MKKIKFETFLEDSAVDLGTGLLASRGDGFCFTLKQPHRWGKDSDGKQILPFGGIGGKLERNELPGASLHRESLEEVDSDVNIFSSSGSCMYMTPNNSEIISLVTDLPQEPLPIIIFRLPRAEAGRKPYTNILIYIGRFTSDSIRPKDDPALIELAPELLLRLMNRPTSIATFQELGGKITSSIEIPSNGILKPIGTAVAAARCIGDTLLFDKVLSDEGRKLWNEFSG